MPILNRAQSTQHPEARLIPEVIWNEIFHNNHFPSALHSWIDYSEEEFRNKSHELSDITKKKNLDSSRIEPSRSKQQKAD